MWIEAAAAFEQSLAALPLSLYEAGETVLAVALYSGRKPT